MKDTIFALASAPGRAGVAVVRLSGPEAGKALRALSLPNELPVPRKAERRALVDPESGELIDRALVLWFPAPHSFTGEDVAELQIHGGRAILQALTEVLRKRPRLRLAEPGEFSRRAFENDKLDLTEVEAIADLVDAETTAQRRQALRQLEGELGRLYGLWAERLKQLLAHIEATIDFAEDELPADLAARQQGNLKSLTEDIESHLDDGHRGERLREGFTVALLGPPNAGKSSLLNALARREAAIVAPTPGTTRDIIEVHLDLGGYPVTLADTAGLREGGDAIENEGVCRAKARAEKADLKLLVFDGALWPTLDETTQALKDDDAIAIVNKTDVIQTPKKAGYAFVSAKTGEGLEGLVAEIIRVLDLRFASLGQPSLTRARHRAAGDLG
ncbi:MAG: tRNA uridine-5-carboxymethylaminomethyl(34) synthesis GTPase MnmE, partial [Alphaproteobacteria bacterium]|nr:tRNA uridine-5-carboxymethylaminomethyl(34) synthesis GTPase MnmE [Alphaproteobacteria bacterium]